MSDDGVPRRCSVQTPESCRAGKAEGLENKHFDNSQDAQQAYEKVMEEKHTTPTLSKNKRRTGNVPVFRKNDNVNTDRKTATGDVPIFQKSENTNSQKDNRTGNVPIFTKSYNPSERNPNTGNVPIFTKRDTANSDLKAGKVPEFKKSNEPVNRDKTGNVPRY